jgi:hypothetical protein
MAGRCPRNQVTPDGASTCERATPPPFTPRQQLTRNSAARRRSAAFGSIEVRAWQLTRRLVTPCRRRLDGGRWWTPLSRSHKAAAQAAKPDLVAYCQGPATRRRYHRPAAKRPGGAMNMVPGASLTALLEADARYPSTRNSATCQSTKSAHTPSTKVRGNLMALALDD